MRAAAACRFVTGRLTLVNRDGGQVASAPVRAVRVKRPWWTLGNGCYAALASTACCLTLRSFGATLASGALGGSIAQTVFGRKATDVFVDALERARGGAG